MNEKAHTLSVVIWFAFLFSQVMFTVVVFLVTGDFILDFKIISENQVFVVLSAVAALNFLASFKLPEILAPHFDAGRGSQPPANQQHTALVLRLALLESVALMGLVISFQSKMNLILPYVALSLIGTAMAFPQRGQRKLSGIVR